MKINTDDEEMTINTDYEEIKIHTNDEEMKIHTQLSYSNNEEISQIKRLIKIAKNCR